MKIYNRPTGCNAIGWALAFVWGSLLGRVTRNSRAGAICLDMTRSTLAATNPLANFGAALALLYYAVRGHVLRMDDTGLYIQLEHWINDQQKAA